MKNVFARFFNLESWAFKNWVVAALVLGILNLPVAASARGEMISTSTVVAELNHQQIRDNVRDLMANFEIQNRLRDQGLDPQDVSQRLASLSDQELQQLAGQIQTQKAGGDVIVIGLGTVLLIVIILLLLRRV